MHHSVNTKNCDNMHEDKHKKQELADGERRVLTSVRCSSFFITLKYINKTLTHDKGDHLPSHAVTTS